MIEGVGRLDEETIGNSETTWFYTDGFYNFHTNSGPSTTFDSGFFMLAMSPVRFVLFDGRTFKYNTEKRRSSCAFCHNRKNIDVEPEELSQVAMTEMPYGYIEYKEIFKRMESEEAYDPKNKWSSICPSCLEEVQSVCSEFDSTEKIVSSII